MSADRLHGPLAVARREIVLDPVPGRGTNAFRKTRRRSRSGLSSTARAITVPPELRPVSTTSASPHPRPDRHARNRAPERN
ncbi:hypothetical protein ACFPN7_13725 [Amycolatopsis halotolerans]|uniref:hypothetical protein n=1 Tax=Amycolatopsis halotolerans TaxID=330083 RepID=UPI00361A1CFE